MRPIPVLPRCRFVNCTRSAVGPYCEEHRFAHRNPQTGESVLGAFFEQLASEGAALVIDNIIPEVSTWKIDQ